MAYTKQDLIDAYCRAMNCQPSDLPEREVLAQKFVDKLRADLQGRLDALPTTGRQQMKRIALKKLADEATAQATTDNAGVDI